MGSGTQGHLSAFTPPPSQTLAGNRGTGMEGVQSLPPSSLQSPHPLLFSSQQAAGLGGRRAAVAQEAARGSRKHRKRGEGGSRGQGYCSIFSGKKTGGKTEDRGPPPPGPSGNPLQAGKSLGVPAWGGPWRSRVGGQQPSHGKGCGSFPVPQHLNPCPKQSCSPQELPGLPLCTVLCSRTCALIPVGRHMPHPNCCLWVPTPDSQLVPLQTQLDFGFETCFPEPWIHLQPGWNWNHP